MSTIEQGVEAFPFEERMLQAVQRIDECLLWWEPQEPTEDEARTHALKQISFLHQQLKQAIAERDRDYERDMDVDADFTDPFADE